jgi:flagellar basal-body rod protein FlgG
MAVGEKNIGSLGSGASVQSVFTDLSSGSMEETGNPLDLAVLGEKGMFAVQMPGGIRYTRDGAFAVNANRQLVTKDGYPVLDDQNRPITLDQGTISIQSDGTIQIDGEAKGKIGLFEATGLSKDGGNRFTATSAQPILGTIKSGAIETSNVNAVDAMVQMIQLSRLFEMSQRSIISQDELSQRLIQSLSDR